MASRPTTTPERIPPPRQTPSPSHERNERTAEIPRASPAASSLVTEAVGLQERLDFLAQQFEQLRDQVRQAQKLAAIGTTAAMIAHEFNNLFTPVVAYARQALDTGDVELMRRALAKTLEQTATMREMADRVIGLAKNPESGIRAVKVRQVVDNAIACLCRKLEKDNLALNVQIDGELAVRANENQLLQVLFNLAINARQAMLGRRGRLSVDAAPTHDGQVQISVRDTGCGIPPEHLEHIFEPFFSTKQHADQPDRRGLGLGLTICRDIIEDLGGTIDVTSQVSVGTTFTIMLPQAD